MTNDTPQYIAASPATGFLSDALATVGALQAAAGEEQLRRSYYDTFDWRLFTAGLLLCADGHGRRARLVLARRSDGQEMAACQLRRKFVFSGDLPPGALRDAVAPVVEMRAMLPVAEVDTRRLRYRLLDENAKTVVRLVEDHPSVRNGADREQCLPARLTIEPVRGYEECFARVRAVCEALPELAAAREDMLTEALAALGTRPGTYSSKLDIPLDPAMPADAATRRILQHLLRTLETNVEGAAADIDSEFLHDLRVAVRRTRSALSQIKGVLPPESTGRFREEFGWLGQVTGPTRDLDVYLLEYAGYRDSLPEVMRDHLQPFHAFLVRHQRREQRRLRKLLRGERFANLLVAWRAFLEGPSFPDPDSAPAASLPIAEVAAARTWRMYRRVLKEGRAITSESPAPELHELRKSCKKLRYLIEFTSSLYPDDQVSPLVKALKRLLDNLGEFQDLQVHADHLHDFTRRMQREGEVPLETLLAMGGLVTGLLQRQAAARRAFARRFAGFDTRENRAAYRELFKPQSAGGGGGESR